MRGLSYLLLGALFIMLIVVASISYISYASLSQIPSVKIETLNNQYKNKMGVIGIFGSTLYVYSASGDSIILDLLIVLVPDGSVYKVYQDLNIVLTSYSLTAINLASLGIIPPAGLTYEDLTYIFVDRDGARYFIDEVDPELGDTLYNFDNIITYVPIEIRGEWDESDDHHDEDEFWLRSGGRGRGLYRISPGIIYVNDIALEVISLSPNRGGRGSLWDVAIIVDDSNIEFIELLKSIIMDLIERGEYIDVDEHGDHTDYLLEITLTISGSFDDDQLFIWTGEYIVEVEVKDGQIVEISFEHE